MAQFGSALDWGSRGHGFKSRYSDQETMRVQGTRIFIYNRNLCEVRTVEIVYKTAEKLCRVS